MQTTKPRPSPSSIPIPSPAAANSEEIRVVDRSGTLQTLDPNELRQRFEHASEGLTGVDIEKVLRRTIDGLFVGIPRRELDKVAIRSAAALTTEDPGYSKVAGRLLADLIRVEAREDGISTFGQSIKAGVAAGIINGRIEALAVGHSREIELAMVHERDRNFEYFGLQTLYDRYLLRHPKTRRVLETPQHFFMRVSLAMGSNIHESLEIYEKMSRLEYLMSSPTLFNAGTKREQLSSCFLLDSPGDHIKDIYERYTDIAMLSKYAGGIGLAYHRVRSRGSLISTTNGHSSGIVPWLKTLDASVNAVNQGGKRKGACCVYLETWHADIFEFLELRDNTGDEAARTHNLNLANWIPDLFMKRVQEDKPWSLFDPKKVPHLCDLYGDAFEQAYLEAESAQLQERSVPARALYARMMRTLAETGNGWITFKDKSNLACNQTAKAGRVVHLSNLCTEIIEVTAHDQTAVCNLGSINLAQHLRAHGDGAEFDWAKLAQTVKIAVRQLDRVIDLNLYPIPSTERSNRRWRPVGLGMMGLADVFFRMKLDFDSDEARELSRRICAEVYFHALSTSCEIAKELGAHPAFAETRAAQGELQFHAWSETPQDPARWESLIASIKAHGLRNSLLIAIAPTATIASIAGVYECIEPQVTNIFKRETMSGDFLQINRYLVQELKDLGLWTPEVIHQIVDAQGSVQGIAAIPEPVRKRYRTAWELSMKSLIDMAAARGPYIDQSQSLNLFSESPEIGKLSSMYMYAWKKGLKTTYYLRSRPATRIAASSGPTSSKKPQACDLENPGSCEACQ